MLYGVNGVLTALLAVVVAAGAALVFVEAVHLLVIRLSRRFPLATELSQTAHRPFRVIVIVYAIQQALRSGVDEFSGLCSSGLVVVGEVSPDGEAVGDEVRVGGGEGVHGDLLVSC